MKVLVISLFGSYSENSNNSRITNIVSAFRDCEVQVVTSNFDHGGKTIKHYQPRIVGKVEIAYLPVAPYKSNLSIARLYSHLLFAIRLKKWLKGLNYRPNLVYCAMPSSTAAYVTGQYCKHNNIPFVIDVIDLWPDSLIPIMPMRKLIKILVAPWKWITNCAYKSADYISAESRSYMQQVHQVSSHVPASYTYIGVDMSMCRKLIQSSQVKVNKPDDEIWLCYSGSLGNSYGFDVVLEAIKYIHIKGIKYKMWFVGDGEKRREIEQFSEECGLNVEITGRLPYDDLLKYLSVCDIAFNSFNENTLVVHSYKFNDYVATNCYVMNNLKGETSEIVENYGIGCNYNKGNLNSCLLGVCLKWGDLKSSLQGKMEKLVREKLDKDIIYACLIDDIKDKLNLR